MAELNQVYLDHAATTPMRPVAYDAVVEELAQTGNPSSLHAAGRRARRIVEESRESVAADLGCRPSGVIFTSGGTEADNMALKGIFWQRNAADPQCNQVVVSSVEHPAVLDTAAWLGAHENAAVVALGVDSIGRVEVDALADQLKRQSDQIAVVSVMWANNELGTVQPVAQIAALCAEAGVPFHCDGVQAVQWLDAPGSLTNSHANATALTVSAHKLGGPVGVGALILDDARSCEPLVHGGGQELGMRAGTAAAAGVAGFAAALRECTTDRRDAATRVAALRDQLVTQVVRSVPGAVLNGDPSTNPDHRLPGHAHMSFLDCESDALLMLLDAAGIACSAGSACTAGVARPSHVLRAIGIDDSLARGSLRFSLGWNSTPGDVAAVVDALPEVITRARRAGDRRGIALAELSGV